MANKFDQEEAPALAAGAFLSSYSGRGSHPRPYRHKLA